MTVAAMRYVLSRIAEALGCSPDDDEDLVEAARRLVAERNAAQAEVERLRGELSALRIQRGTERARDGWAEVERLRAEVSRREREHEALVETAQQVLAHVEAERDEARAEVERLRARVRSVDRSTDYNGKAFSDGESSQEDLAIVASERDEALAEVEKLRDLIRRSPPRW